MSLILKSEPTRYGYYYKQQSRGTSFRIFPNQQIKICKILCKYDTNAELIQKKTTYGISPLCQAIIKVNLQCIEILLRYKAPLEESSIISETSLTPLQLAAR